MLLFQLLLLFMLYINDHKFLYLSILPRFKPIQKKLHSSFDTDSPLDRQFASPNSPIQYWLALSYQTTTDGIFGVTDIISRKFFYVMAGNLFPYSMLVGPFLLNYNVGLSRKFFYVMGNLISLFNAGWPSQYTIKNDKTN